MDCSDYMSNTHWNEWTQTFDTEVLERFVCKECGFEMVKETKYWDVTDKNRPLMREKLRLFNSNSNMR